LEGLQFKGSLGKKFTKSQLTEEKLCVTEVGDWKDCSSRAAWAKSSQNPNSLKKNCV
jgi:hypothetical protein